jgi:hypothetical protein
MKKAISTAITSANIAQVLELLASAPGRLVELSAPLAEEQLRQPLGVGERSMTENIAHLLHCEALSVEFITLALLTQDHTFHGLHPERDYGKLLRFDLLSFGELLEYFKLRRKVLLRVLLALKPEQWRRALPEKGKHRQESVYWRARGIALHELEHLDDIKQKLHHLETNGLS